MTTAGTLKYPTPALVMVMPVTTPALIVATAVALLPLPSLRMVTTALLPYPESSAGDGGPHYEAVDHLGGGIGLALYGRGGQAIAG